MYSEKAASAAFLHEKIIYYLILLDIENEML